MSKQNVEIVRRFYEVWNGADRASATLSFLHPEFEWVNPAYAVEPGIRHGEQGFLRVLRSLDAVFDHYEHRPGHFIDAGERVLCYAIFHARARGGGVDFQKSEPHLWTIRDSKIMRLQWFHDEREALDAVGLPE
jgi:ketosteroid isomerase-like protein